MKELQHIVGKRVRVKDCVEVNYGTNHGKIKVDVIGEVTYIGSNKYLGWPLQITVGRTPLQLESLKQIELIENEG
jgi:hypothetical protein